MSVTSSFINKPGLAGALVVLGHDFEAELFADVLHGVIVRQNLPDDARQFFRATHGDELLEQLKTEALILPVVVDEHGEFRLVRAVLLAQPTDAENQFFAVILRRFQLRHERNFAVVIVEANALQSFVRDALRQV